MQRRARANCERALPSTFRQICGSPNRVDEAFALDNAIVTRRDADSGSNAFDEIIK